MQAEAFKNCSDGHWVARGLYEVSTYTQGLLRFFTVTVAAVIGVAVGLSVTALIVTATLLNTAADILVDEVVEDILL